MKKSKGAFDKWGKAQAAKYLRDLNEKFVFIAQNPRLNRERNELKQPIRIHHYENHIILYATTLNDTVHIVRVLHQSLDISRSRFYAGIDTQNNLSFILRR